MIAERTPCARHPSAWTYPPAVGWQALFSVRSASVAYPKERNLSALSPQPETEEEGHSVAVTQRRETGHALPAFAVRASDSFFAIFR